MVAQISARKLKSRLDAGERPTVLDVREVWELDIARLPHTVHIPMGELARRVTELDAGRELIVMCRSGAKLRCSPKRCRTEETRDIVIYNTV